MEKHQQTPLDIYFNALEEAYGNLPVPSDDWAGIRGILGAERFDPYELEVAIEVIREHYMTVAEVLGKKPKFG